MSWLVPSWLGSSSAPIVQPSVIVPTSLPDPPKRPFAPPTSTAARSPSPDSLRKRERGGLPRGESYTGPISSKDQKGREEEDWSNVNEQPAPKKSRIARTVETGLSIAAGGATIAVGGAILTTAVALHAYRLWRDPKTTGDDIDAHLARTSRAKGSAQNSPRLQIDAPPPYTVADRPSPQSSTVTQSPSHSQIPRLIRHAHPPRPRPSHSRRSFPPTDSPVFPTPLDSPAAAPEEPTASSPFRHSFSFAVAQQSREIPRFQPMETDTQDSDPDLGSEDDEEMQAVAARLKDLIESGAEALAAQPEWDLPLVENEDRNSYMAPKSAPLSSIETFSASPRGPPPRSSIPLPISGTPRRSLGSLVVAPNTPSSASRHARRHSEAASGFGSPSASSLPKPSRSAGHTPRSSKGGSLAGVPGEGAGLVPLERYGQ